MPGNSGPVSILFYQRYIPILSTVIPRMKICCPTVSILFYQRYIPILRRERFGKKRSPCSVSILFYQRYIPINGRISDIESQGMVVSILFYQRYIPIKPRAAEIPMARESQSFFTKGTFLYEGQNITLTQDAYQVSILFYQRYIPITRNLKLMQKSNGRKVSILFYQRYIPIEYHSGRYNPNERGCLNPFLPKVHSYHCFISKIS